MRYVHLGDGGGGVYFAPDALPHRESYTMIRRVRDPKTDYYNRPISEAVYNISLISRDR